MSSIENISAAQSNILAATQRQSQQQFGLVPGESTTGDEVAQTNGNVQTQTRDAVQATDETEEALVAADEDEQEEDQLLSDQQLQQAEFLAQNGGSGRGAFLNIQL